MSKAKRDLSRVRHHTKIVATLGPATSDEEILEHMFRVGLDVVRMKSAASASGWAPGRA